MYILRFILELYDSWKKVALRSPHLKIYHVLLAIWYFYPEKILGRYSLMNRLELSEATTKTLINFLKRNGILASIPKKGHYLTQKGKLLGVEIEKHFTIVSDVKNLDKLVVCSEKSIIVVRNASDKVSDGLRERDNALLAGACGATTLIVNENKSILLPSSEPLAPPYQKALKEILHILPADVIIIGSGKNKKVALFGALAAAISLLLSTNK